MLSLFGFAESAFVAGEIVVLSVIGVVVIIAGIALLEAETAPQRGVACGLTLGSAICTPLLGTVNPAESALREWMTRVGTG